MRQNVYCPESGQVIGWFKLNAAEEFKNRYRWDGSNNISLSAGRCNHEALYKTAGGEWVKNFSSEWQGTKETWHYITAEEAKAWLLLNEYKDEEILEATGERLSEESRTIGRTVNTRLSEESLAQLDQLAVEKGTSRADLIRRAVDQYLYERGE